MWKMSVTLRTLSFFQRQATRISFKPNFTEKLVILRNIKPKSNLKTKVAVTSFLRIAFWLCAIQSLLLLFGTCIGIFVEIGQSVEIGVFVRFAPLLTLICSFVANISCLFIPIYKVSKASFHLRKALLSTTTTQLCENTEDAGEPVVEKKKNPRELYDVDTSKRYMASKAYSNVYGVEPVWKTYRRNFKGQFAPIKTRKQCIRSNEKCGNPCPICRDDYLVLHPSNVDLLKQFIDPHTGNILSYSLTGVCQQQQKQIFVNVEKAFDYGYLDMPLQHKKYNFEEYYPQLKEIKNDVKT